MYVLPGMNRRYWAARRALSIVNRMRPGPFRARHTTRIFSNMNRLRVA